MSASIRWSVRPEQTADVAAIHEVESLAFGQAAEADLVDRLRGVQPSISLVAVASEKVIGHVLFTPMSLREEATSSSALGLAPLAVHPEHQRRTMKNHCQQMCQDLR